MFPLSYYSQFGVLLVVLVIGHVRALIGPSMHRSNGVSSGKIAMNAATVMATMPAADLTPAVDKFVRFPEGNAASVERMGSIKMKHDGPAPNGPDPFKYVAGELSPLSDFVKDMLSSENPVLSMAASHFFEKRQGKRFRPTTVALMARAVAGTDEVADKRYLQLGQITEMIHVASLIHDDVLDEADTRRGGQAVHTMYTNKVAVLAGDFLLARASVLLARLQHFQVVEVMASALDALVQGEIMQARGKKEDLLDIDFYLRKSYFKTASLICSSCKCTALLAGYGEQDPVTVAAEQYGYHMGMAYQIVDDILDFTGASATLGKPAQADMELGLSTAPVLFASEEVPDIKALILRRFKEEGDVMKAVELSQGTDCIAKSYDLAEFHAQQAMDALDRMPSSDARAALQRLLHVAISRTS